MKALVLVLLLSFSPVFTAAQELPDPAIEGVISQQFEAFKRDDFAAAFGFASPVIKGIFQTPERFGAMVRGGFPMVWRPKSVRFLELRVIDGRIVQLVQVTDLAGETYHFAYEMVETSEGWQINGVTPVPAPGLSA